MNNRTTELLMDSRVVHTRYHGTINCLEILSCITDWTRLLKQHHELAVLIFDYTDATWAPVTKDEVIQISRATASLTDIRKDVAMIGVVPKDIDYGLSRMWQVYSESDSSAKPEQMHIFRKAEEALTLARRIIGDT